MKYYLLLILLLPLTCLAQISITGKVTNAIDNKPIASASVFLSNATVGNKTTEAGSFTLNYVKQGQYELVVSVVGYEAYKQTIMAGNDDIALPEIKLLPKTMMLNEVKVRPQFDREKYLAEFKRQFLGQSDMAAQCTILNPDIINIDYDPDTKQLTANTDDFLEIENKALGYSIEYFLYKFIKDDKIRRVYYEGAALFTAMDGTPSQTRRWKKRRYASYEGSGMQFFRDVVANRVDSNFVIIKMAALPHGDRDTLKRDTLTTPDFVHRTDRPGMFAIGFDKNIYVWYAPVQPGKPVNPKKRRGDMVGKLTLLDKYIFFDNNGTIVNPESAVFDFRWGASRVTEMLPIDYEPEIEK